MNSYAIVIFWLEEQGKKNSDKSHGLFVGIDGANGAVNGIVSINSMTIQKLITFHVSAQPLAQEDCLCDVCVFHSEPVVFLDGVIAANPVSALTKWMRIDSDIFIVIAARKLFDQWKRLSLMQS